MADTLGINYYEYEPVALEVKDFPSTGFILDIGGGGEGVIGQLKGKDVIAIDLSRAELDEAAEGPLKIVMDARKLQFVENSFQTATAFFSLMFLDSEENLQKVFSEVYRVLKEDGVFYIWDIDLEKRPVTEKKKFVIPVLYTVNGVEKSTGYGQPWPEDRHSMAEFCQLANRAGFQVVASERTKNTFHLVLKK